MGGICGFSQTAGAVNRDVFEAAVDMVHYRGPHGRGAFYEEGLALGQRQLAASAPSPTASQPHVYEKVQTLCVLDGEFYNRPALQADLAQKGYAFASGCNAEVLLAAYDCYGPACVQHFNGMWAFAIYNRATKQLFCSRDRFGVKPFYYFLREGDFCFASEIKQLLPFFGKAKANRPALARFLVLGETDGGTGTLFEGISQLEPGHNLLFHLATRQLTITQWYNLFSTPAVPPAASPSNSVPSSVPGSTPGAKATGKNNNYQSACQNFHRLFTQAVSLRLQADVPLGSCLSGGLDSSAIVGAMHQQLAAQGKTGALQTVSSCYNQAEYNEQSYIKLVLQRTGAVSHKVFPTLANGPEWLDKLIWHCDEPVPSSSPYSQWCVFEEAKKQGLGVLLDGQGPDEQLGGYAQFYPVYFVELLKKAHFITFFRELRGYKRLRSAYQPVPALAVAGFCLLSAFLPRRLMRLINARVLKTRKPALFSLPLWRELLLDSNQYTLPATRQFIQQNMGAPLRQLLHLEDRNSMAHGVEARIPFLDPALVQCAWEMPFRYKIRDGMSKAVLRDGLADFLPPAIRARQNKMGFPAPEADWVLQNRDWFQAELAEACQRFAFALDENAVMAGFASYAAKPQRGEFVWWRLMCANRWAKIFDVSV